MQKQDKLERFRYLVSGYFGIREIDGYDLKPYILVDIENYIKNYVKSEELEEFDLEEEVSNIELNHNLKEKLNNSLIILREMDGPMDLIVLIKRTINRLKK